MNYSVCGAHGGNGEGRFDYWYRYIFVRTVKAKSVAKMGILGSGDGIIANGAVRAS